MYTKDKKQRITLRLNDEQFDFVRMNSDMLGVSPSDFLRMVINASLSAYKAGLAAKEGQEAFAFTDSLRETIDSTLEKAKEGEGRANDETDQYNIV